MPDLVTVGLAVPRPCLPAAACILCRMPHAAAACFLRMWQKFCVCFVAAFLRVLSKKFFVDFGACGKGNVQQQLERMMERGTRSVRKIVAYFCANLNALFAYAHLTPAVPCRTSPCLASPAARKFSSKFDKLLATPLCPFPFACLHSSIPLPVGCMRCTLICTHSFDVQKLSASFSAGPPSLPSPPPLLCLSFDELILAVSYNKTFLIPTFLI